MELFNIFIKSAFIENMVLAYFLGMCSYLAVSKTVKTAFGLGLAVIFVLGITIPINWLINDFLLSDTGLFHTDLTFVITSYSIHYTKLYESSAEYPGTGR